MRDLPLAPTRGERRHVNFNLSRFGGTVGQPASVGRELALPNGESALEKGVGLAVSEAGQNPQFCRGLSWAGAEELAVTAAGAGGQRQIVVTDADGYAPRSLSLERLQGQPVDVNGAPGQALIAVTDGRVIWAQVEGWRRIATGTAAVHSG